MITLQCKHCGIDFESVARRRKCCSRKCSGLLNSHKLIVRNRKRGLGKTKTKCTHCDKEIVKPSIFFNKYEKPYCSHECKKLDQIKHITVKCIVCGKDVTRHPSEIKRSNSSNTYCSRKCYFVDFGNRQRGMKNPAWNGGISSDIKKERETKEGRAWKRGILYRDNYTCQKCGKRGGTLNAHHIKSFTNYPKLRLDLNNGITYCLKCHKEEHKINGKPFRSKIL